MNAGVVLGGNLGKILDLYGRQCGRRREHRGHGVRYVVPDFAVLIVVRC